MVFSSVLVMIAWQHAIKLIVPLDGKQWICFKNKDHSLMSVVTQIIQWLVLLTNVHPHLNY